MTPCDRLPDIFRYGGLLSLTERTARGIAEPAQPHYWGAVGKKKNLADYVISSFLPPWWMCQRHDEELAMILLDAESLCAHPEARFCPVNSAKSDYNSVAIRTRNGVAAFDDCFENETTYQARNAEVFMYGQILLADFRELIICDRQAADCWGPKINEAFRNANPKPPPPDKMSKTIIIGGTARHRFPGNYSPQRRLRDA
jgi:hypothetical protein